MSEPTTSAASSVDAQIASMEQEVNASLNSEAGATETTEKTIPTPQRTQEENAPEYGQAFKELAAKKGFRDPDDLVRAYTALESRNTKETQKSRSLEDQLEQIQKMKNSSETTNEQQQALEVLENTIEKVLSKRLRPIEDVVGVQKVDRMVGDLQQAFPDFKGAVVDETLNYMVDHPNLSMEDAFKIVSWGSVRDQRKVQETRQAQDQQKSRAYMEPAGHAKVSDNINYSKLSLDELEEIIPAAGDFVNHKGTLRRG